MRFRAPHEHAGAQAHGSARIRLSQRATGYVRCRGAIARVENKRGRACDRVLAEYFPKRAADADKQRFVLKHILAMDEPAYAPSYPDRSD